MHELSSSLYIYLLLILLVGGLVSRFIFIWHPNEVVFDEVHFGKFFSAYFTGNYYFDIHPPLGKLLIALFVNFFGFRPNFGFESIGERYPDSSYIYFRFLPNLFGSLIPIAIFLFLLEIGFSWRSAFLASWMVLFDNAFLVQSHFILVDAFLISFGLFGLYFFFKSRNNNYDLKSFILSILFLTFSFSIKWTGLGFYALSLFVLIKDNLKKKYFRRLIKLLSLFSVIPLLIYMLIFFVHFKLLPNPGPGDAYMSSQFLKKGFLGKFLELNIAMYVYNKNIRTEHPYASPAWLWPLMSKPVYFWVSSTGDGYTSRIYLLGNPSVWLLSTLGLIFALFFWKPKKIDQKTILYLGYLINFLPFFLIKRPLFLYHYLVPLIFAVSIFSDLFVKTISKLKINRDIIFIFSLSLILILFLYLSPLSYGLPLKETEFNSRFWFKSWF